MTNKALHKDSKGLRPSLPVSSGLYVLRKMNMYQLRIYEVNPEKRVAFHERFQNHAMRIMKKYGFKIVALWESVTASKLEFIYILNWPDMETMERQWKAFLADQEWIDIKKKMDLDIGEPVLKATGRVLEAVKYSPISAISVP